MECNGPGTAYLWSTAANWTGSVPDGIGGNAIINADATGDQLISIESGRTIGNIFFQDTAIASAASFSVGVVGGTNALTLDVTSGRSVINVAALGAGSKKAITNAPVINNDGILKLGAGQFSFRGASPSFTSDLVAAGGLTDTRNFLSGLTALQVLKRWHLPVRFRRCRRGLKQPDQCGRAGDFGRNDACPSDRHPARASFEFQHPDWREWNADSHRSCGRQ
jgi:hypothetical protein